MHYFRKTGIFLILGLLLGIYEGKIAIWHDDDPSPARVFPYSVSSLPPQEQEALRRGIKVSDKQELGELLEDYLS